MHFQMGEEVSIAISDEENHVAHRNPSVAMTMDSEICHFGQYNAGCSKLLLGLSTTDLDSLTDNLLTILSSIGPWSPLPEVIISFIVVFAVTKSTNEE
jgi:hypothetical protein